MHGIYRTCFQGQFQPEVLDIHPSKTARRPKITGLATPSAASNTSFIRFSLVCFTDWVIQFRFVVLPGMMTVLTEAY